MLNAVVNERYLEIYPPKEFSFDECLVYLGRSSNECLHEVHEGVLYKLIEFDGELIVLTIKEANGVLRVEFSESIKDNTVIEGIKNYVIELLDLKRNLEPFYKLAEKDDILRPLVHRYYGLRIVGIPDLFEALVWAIIGQQINLNFAYTLKRRFVEGYGRKYIWNGKGYWLFPKPEVIAELKVSDLKPLQFTTKKSEYIIGVAKEIAEGRISKEKLLSMENHEEMQKALTDIRGIGKWSADYALMKCIRSNRAFPITDVGLQNAIKIQLALKAKPNLNEIQRMAENWREWEAYATFYLWRTLND